MLKNLNLYNAFIFLFSFTKMMKILCYLNKEPGCWNSELLCCFRNIDITVKWNIFCFVNFIILAITVNIASKWFKYNANIFIFFCWVSGCSYKYLDLSGWGNYLYINLLFFMNFVNFLIILNIPPLRYF